MQEDRTKLSPQSNKLFFYLQDLKGKIVGHKWGRTWRRVTKKTSGQILFAAQVQIGVLTRLGKQQDMYVHILLINGQQGNNFCIVMSAVNRKDVRKGATCDVTLFPAAAKQKKQAHMLHTPRPEEVSERTHPLFLHPFLSCWYLASHVCYHYIPLSRCTEGRGTVTDLSSAHNKRTTGNFAFDGLNMHERPKCVRARGLPLCDPLFNSNMHEQTYPLPQSNRWKRVSNSAWWAPILFSITLCTEDSWEADIPSSQLSLENKRVWDPSYTHVHVCMWPPSPTITTKNCQFNYRLIIFQQVWKNKMREAKTPPNTPKIKGWHFKIWIISIKRQVSICKWLNLITPRLLVESYLVAAMCNLRVLIIIKGRRRRILTYYLIGPLQISPVTLVTALITLQKLK